MADRSTELRAILDSVRARWSRRAFLRAWMLGAVTAGLLLLTRRARQQDLMPYGAFLCGCALVALAL